MSTSNQTLKVANGHTIKIVKRPLSSLPTLPFDLENIQYLSAEEALRHQDLLGHGNTFGRWETPRSLAPTVRVTEREIELATRVKAYIPSDLLSHPGHRQLVTDAVLYLTRWALLCRLGPVGFGTHAHGSPLDASTIAQKLYQDIPKILAKSIERRLTDQVQIGDEFVGMLTRDDIRVFYCDQFTKRELERMRRLKAAGLWSDEPPHVEFHSVTTQVKAPRKDPKQQTKQVAYQPLPDWYMEEIGPRVLWLIKDLGPNLIHILRHLLAVQQEKRVRETSDLAFYVRDYFVTNVWRDREGKELKPPFELRLSKIGSGRCPNKTAYAWPPRDHADLISLVATLQRAHLFMALLLMAARHSEVLTLERDCVRVDEDSQARIRGKTYKATTILEGKDRKWPAPSILIHTFAQQKELVQVMEQLDALLDETISRRTAFSQQNHNKRASESNHLWASLGASSADPAVALEHLGRVLPDLSRAIALDDKPDGMNLHPHRLRKTMARLAGIAIDGSQKVLMRLLGHEDVTTTLHYMQSDPAFHQEVQDVIRELRLLRMEETIESAREALRAVNSLPNGGLGGGGAAVLSQTIVKHEEWLHRQGKEWGAGESRELAVLLADNGRAARLIAPGVVCTKSTHERGLCNSRMGAITPGNCKVECHSHIELAVGRRDVQNIIPILVQHTTISVDNGEWLAAMNIRKQLMHEMSRFPDIAEEWQANQEVQRLLAISLEDGL